MAHFRLTARKIVPKESEVAKACVNWLAYHGYKAERLNVGLFWTQDGRRHPEGRPGRPDYLVCHAKYPGFYLEIKAPGGKLSPEQQMEHMNLERGWGIEVAVVDSVTALIAWLEEREKRISAPVVSERAESGS